MKKRKGFFLFPLMGIQKKWLLNAIIAGFLYSVMLVATPFLVSFILNFAEKGSMLGFQYNIGVLISILLLFCITIMLIFMIYKRSVNHFIYSIKLAIEKKAIYHILNYEKSPSRASNIINHDIPDFCKKYYVNIFKIIVSSSFIVGGLVFSAIISIYAFIIEVFFLFIAVIIQISPKKILSYNYDCFRNEKQSAIKMISNFINGKLTIESNSAFTYANSIVGKKIRRKADAEYSFLFCKRVINVVITTIPMIATLFSSLLFVVLISEGIVNKNEVLAGTFIVGYMIWELFKIVPLLNEITTIKSICSYVEMIGFMELPKEEGEISCNKNQTNRNYREIELCNVSVRFQEKIALNNINIKFKPSKKYLILGNSGSGKSTLLQAIMNLVPYTGAIVDESSSETEYQKYLNYLPQDVEMFPGTISDNIAIKDQYSKTEIKTVLKKANYLNVSGEEVIELDEIIFSGGEQKKIAFARAMFHKNKKNILLLDEPFEGLDNSSRLSIEKEILCHKGLVLVVSHIVDDYFLERVDEIIIFEAGIIIYAGDYLNIPDNLKLYYLNRT